MPCRAWAGVYAASRPGSTRPRPSRATNGCFMSSWYGPWDGSSRCSVRDSRRRRRLSSWPRYAAACGACASIRSWTMRRIIREPSGEGPGAWSYHRPSFTALQPADERRRTLDRMGQSGVVGLHLLAGSWSVGAVMYGLCGLDDQTTRRRAP
jgi:hypothetical protein